MVKNLLLTMMVENFTLDHLKDLLTKWDWPMENFLKNNLELCKNNFLNGELILLQIMLLKLVCYLNGLDIKLDNLEFLL